MNPIPYCMLPCTYPVAAIKLLSLLAVYQLESSQSSVGQTVGVVTSEHDVEIDLHNF